MLLYFPSVKIVKCDLIPTQYGASYIFHFKSTINSPKHYPSHPLIDGKIEFVGKIEDVIDLKFWFNYILGEENHKLLKNKFISCLIEFDPSLFNKIKFVGLGKKDNDAYFLTNKIMKLSPNEHLAKLNYELKLSKNSDKKRVKV